MLEGSTYQLGDFSIEITKGPEWNQHPVFDHPSKQHFNTSIYAPIPLAPEQMWQAKGRSVEMRSNGRGHSRGDLGTGSTID